MNHGFEYLKESTDRNLENTLDKNSVQKSLS